VQIAPGTHRPHARVPQEARTVIGMLRLETLRDEQLDRLAQQLFARVAEQALHLAVDEHHRARRVDHHQAAGGGFHGGP